MNKFVYRMQNILDIKLKLEEQERANFAMAMMRLEQEKQKLMELYARKADYEEKTRMALRDTLSITEIKYCRHAIDAMRSAIRTQMIEVHVQAKNVEQARAKLNEVMSDRKTHEKLKEYAFDAYKAEYAKEEEKEIDQSVTYRYTTSDSQ